MCLCVCVCERCECISQGFIRSHDLLHVLLCPSDPRDHRVHQPAEDPERLHAELLQGPQGVHPGLAAVPEQRPQGARYYTHTHTHTHTLPIPVAQGVTVSVCAADDRRGGEPGGGAEGRVLPRALVPGGRQPLLLLQGNPSWLRVRQLAPPTFN